MKIKIIPFLMAAFITLAACALLASCAKEGPQGIPGATGPAGADGSEIYAGDGAPATSLGKDGDYYLDKSAGNLYGPKTDAGWGTALSLSGGQGGSGQQAGTEAKSLAGAERRRRASGMSAITISTRPISNYTDQRPPTVGERRCCCGGRKVRRALRGPRA